jgi:hypothetical protein
MDIRKWLVPIAGASLGALVLFGVHVVGPPPSVTPVAAGPEPSLARLSPRDEARQDLAVQSVLAFVLLHETGHLLISELDLPVLGREEDAADRFAVATMTINGASKNYDALLPVAAFWDAVHHQQSRFDWSNEHGEPEQRAFDVFCLAYGENPERYGQMADQIRLDGARKAACPSEARKNIRDWNRVLTPYFRSPGEAGPAPSVAIVYDPVPPEVSGAVRAELENDLAYAKDSDALEVIGDQLKNVRFSGPAAGSSSATAGVRHPGPAANLADFDYVLRGNACVGASGAPIADAWWNPKSRTLTPCYGLIAQIRHIETALIAQTTNERR